MRVNIRCVLQRVTESFRLEERKREQCVLCESTMVSLLRYDGLEVDSTYWHCLGHRKDWKRQKGEKVYKG